MVTILPVLSKGHINFARENNAKTRSLFITFWRQHLYPNKHIIEAVEWALDNGARLSCEPEEIPEIYGQPTGHCLYQYYLIFDDDETAVMWALKCMDK